MTENKSLFIAVDFDGTCVSHAFPEVGKDVGAVPVLRQLVQEGHKLILFTMRSDRLVSGDTGDVDVSDVTGTFLTDAVNWFKENEIELYGIQENPTQKIWTTSPKPYAHLYIDDAALGCPLKVDLTVSNLPFVDWVKVKNLLIKNKILTNKTCKENDTINNICSSCNCN